MDLSKASPAEVRAMIRTGEITGQTSGMCNGYAQANLAILPKDLAFDFLLFTQRNKKPCPVLDVTEAGSPRTAPHRARRGYPHRHPPGTASTGRASSPTR